MCKSIAYVVFHTTAFTRTAERTVYMIFKPKLIFFSHSRKEYFFVKAVLTALFSTSRGCLHFSRENKTVRSQGYPCPWPLVRSQGSPPAPKAPEPTPRGGCLSPWTSPCFPARPSLQWDLRGHGFPLAGGVADARLLPSVNAPGSRRTD